MDLSEKALQSISQCLAPLATVTQVRQIIREETLSEDRIRQIVAEEIFKDGSITRQMIGKESKDHHRCRANLESRLNSTLARHENTLGNVGQSINRTAACPWYYLLTLLFFHP